MEPPAPGAALVFEHRAPLWLLLLRALAWPASLLVPVAALVLALEPPFAVTELTTGVPGGALAYKGTLSAIALTGWTIGLLVGALVDRRFGWCEVDGDLLRFRPFKEASFPLSDFALHRVTEHGVVLRRRGQTRLSRWLAPLLVPARGDLEQRRALAALRGLDADPEADDWRGSLAPGAPWWVRAVQLGQPVAAVVGLVVLSVRLQPGSDELKTAMFLFFALTFVGWNVFDALIGKIHGFRLHAGREHLLLDGAKHLWGEVTHVAADGEYLVVDTASRCHLVWLGPGGAARERFLEVLATRVAPRRVEPTLPVWAQARARVRRTTLGLLAAFASLLAMLLLSLSNPDLPAESMVTDRVGNGARLVHRVGGRGPARLLYLVADGPWRTLDEEFFPHDRIAAGGIFGALGEEQVASARDRRRFAREFAAERGEPAQRTVSEANAILDLAAGTGIDPLGRPFSLPGGTTVVVLGEAGVETASVALPDALLQLLSASGRRTTSLHDRLEPALAPLAHDHPAVARWLRGETSRRHIIERDPAGWTLAWGVDHGEVMFAFVVAPGGTVHATWSGPDAPEWRRRHYVHQTNPNVVLRLPAERFAVIDAAGQARAGLPAPTLDALHDATARVRAGSSVPAAIRVLPPEWSAR